MKKAPDRLTEMTRSQSSSVILATVRSIVMPALLTRMSSQAVLVDDLLQHAAAVVGVADVAFMQGGAAAWVLLGHGGEELLGRLVLPPVPGGD